ncbi:MAG: peptide chain release factor N(5)-glutamine methyltransferase [Candidatus Berkelbacteria bacterium]|nr:peptide chain release factor N(5)-glutamine methyltransferase [Candidatus Berkelbacteria bacterium]
MKKYQEIKKQIIGDLKTAGISSAEIDAQILLEFVTKKSREFLLSHPEYELSAKEYKSILKLVDRRKSIYPIAYLTGHKEFFALDFLVTPDVLIPRPETEQLVEIALDFLKARSCKLAAILDVGTGSGNIIISIAKFITDNPVRFDPIGSKWIFSASDNSAKALTVAKKNAKKHNVKITFIKSDLFENIKGKFGLIVANLPYVPIEKCNRFSPIESNQLHFQEIDFEPQNAIFAGDNGAEIIKRFLLDAKKYINNNGLILAELDPRNADDILVFTTDLYSSAEIISDFSGQKRLLKVLT